MVTGGLSQPTARRPAIVWAGVGAAISQAICLLGLALVDLVVSYSFCDSSGALQPGYCDVRGPRWLLWVGCQLLLLLAGVAVPALALIGVGREAARRRLVQVEGGVAVVALITGVMAVVTNTAVVVPIALVLVLGVVVVAGMRARGKPGTL